jgi:hypothetical protein
VRRVPRRPKQHITEPDWPVLPRAERGHTDSGRELAYAEGAEVNGDAHGYAHEHKKTYETKEQPDEERWYVCWSWKIFLFLITFVYRNFSRSYIEGTVSFVPLPGYVGSS